MMNQQKPMFSIFGTQQQQPQNTSGGGLFGSSNTAAQPTTTTTTSAFNFGNGSPASTGSSGLFGKPATTGSPFGNSGTTTTGFGSGFGTQQTGFGAFGSTNTNQQPAATTTTNTGFGGLFGGQNQQQQQQQQQQSKPLFSLSGNTQQQQQPTTNVFNLSGNIGQSQQTKSMFSFNTGGLGLGQQQQQQQQQLQQQQQQQLQQQQQAANFIGPNYDENFMSKITNPQVFNDERDIILAKWNQLQVLYGRGKVFIQNESLDIKDDNRFSKFKTVGYSCKQVNRDEDGLICLILNQKEQFVKANQKSISDNLFKVFDSNQTLSIQIDSIKPLTDDKTEVIFYVNQQQQQQQQQQLMQQQQNVQQSVRRVPASTLFSHMNKPEQTSTLRTTPTIKQLLDQISVLNFYPMVSMSDEQVRAYLEKAPAGLDPALWEQAKKNNPNARKLLPIQMIGFESINKRFKMQGRTNEAHKEMLSRIGSSIESINAKNKLLKAKIEQFRARNENLEQRVLRVFIQNELRRKMGLPLQDQEIYLINVLTAFQSELNSPVNKEILRQKFNELLEVIKTLEQNTARKQNNSSSASNSSTNSSGSSSYASSGAADSVVDKSTNQAEILKSLKEEQKAIKSLIDIVNKDIHDLGLIERELSVK